MTASGATVVGPAQGAGWRGELIKVCASNKDNKWPLACLYNKQS